jgi:hypothetical protein
MVMRAKSRKSNSDTTIAEKFGLEGPEDINSPPMFPGTALSTLNKPVSLRGAKVH